MHDQRVEFEEHAAQRLAGLMRQLVRVAVDVYEGILRPVRRRLPRQGVAIGLALQKSVEPFDLLVPPIGIANGVDEHHHVFANASNHRLLGNGETVRQFENRLRGAGFVRMQCGIEVIEGPRIGDQMLRGGAIEAARIRKRSIRGFQRIQILDALLIGDRQQDNVATLLRTADGEHAHARGSCRQSAAVCVGFGGVDQLSRRAGNASPKSARRRHAGRRRQVGNPRREKARLRRRLGDLLHRPRFRGVGSDYRLRRRLESCPEGETQQQKSSIQHEPALLVCGQWVIGV